MRAHWLMVAIGWLAIALASSVVAQPFTYQGMLKQNGQPVNGTLTMTFTLYRFGDPFPIGSITQNVSVQNGLFTVELDFGSLWYDPWLELEIKIGAAPNQTVLSPRVKLTGAPYAINALYSMKPWEPNGSAIFYNNGNVGIGMNSPGARLSLGSSNANTKLALWQGNAAGEIMGLGVMPNQFRLHLNSSGERFSFLNAPNGNELVTILGTGKVGIGTSNPAERLHIVGGNLRVDNGEIQSWGPITLHPDVDGTGDSNVHIKSDLTVEGNGFSLGGRLVRAGVESVDVYRDGGVDTFRVGRVDTFGENRRIVSLSYPIVYGYPIPNNGSVSAYSSSWNPNKASVWVNNDNLGVLTANIKNFCVPDPEDATRDIWYGCIEGPELAMYVRGTARLVNGRARIELPDHFRKLADEQGMTVQLTPRSAQSKGLAVVQAGLDGIEVGELRNGRGNYEFDWEVKAVRKEHRDFEVYRSWDYVLPGGMERSEVWEARLKSLEARQARQRTQSPARAPEGGKAR
ncbi:MAG: hypothetical protein SNJ72_10325 [Fimbriimonadales bacterium]